MNDKLWVENVMIINWRFVCLLFLGIVAVTSCQRRKEAFELQSHDPTIRATAIKDVTSAVVNHRIDASTVKRKIPMLIECLRDSNPNVRREAIDALSQIGSPAIRDLAEASNNKDALIRSGAIVAMGSVNERLYERQFQPNDDKQFFPLIEQSLHDEDARVRKSAARSLAIVSIGAKKTTEALQRLITVLDDPDADVRGWAARSIGKLADTPVQRQLLEVAVQRIARLLQEEEIDTRLAALIALGDLSHSTETAVPALARALRDKDEIVRLNVYEHLVHTAGPAKSLAVPFLVKAFNDNNTENRFHVVQTLRRLQPLPDSVIPLLLTALNDESPGVRNVAIMTLGDMEHPPHNAVPVLHNILNNCPGRTKVSVARVLYKAGDKPENFLPVLLTALQDDDPSVREISASTLSNMGSTAKSAVPLLEKLANTDSDEKTRIVAKLALHHILNASEK